MKQKEISRLIRENETLKTENEILRIKGYTTIDLNTPVWKLSIGDLLDLIKQATQTPKPESETTVKDFTDENLVYGLAGFARLLGGCSERTASRIISSGKIDGAVIQRGRILIIDSLKALELLQKSKS